MFDLGAHDRPSYNADVFSSMGSLISLEVSVDVKHHVYLLTYCHGIEGCPAGDVCLVKIDCIRYLSALSCIVR